jgi:hypothetical protein
MSEMPFRNPVFSRPAQAAIDMEVEHPTFGWIPFTASPDDPEEHGRQLYDAAFSDAAPYVAPSAEQARAGMPHLSARQLRLGLIDNGIMPSQVQATLNAMPAGEAKEKAMVEWEFASSFERMHPLIASVGTALGLNDAQIDGMWEQAAQL